jgi:hypothetical protein
LSNHHIYRISDDNPHGFTDKVLARLNAIENPAEREKAMKEALQNRRKRGKVGRSVTHWSRRISEANPRGHTEITLQRIRDAPTPKDKLRIELSVLRVRIPTEKKLKKPIDDEYSFARIAAMKAEVRAEYAAASSGTAPPAVDTTVYQHQ